MIKNSLEARIAKLEKLLYGRKSVKTEGRLPDLDEVMQRMMEDLMSGDSMDYNEWIETLEAGAAGELDDTVEWYAEEYDLPENEVRRMLMRVARQCLRDIENGDPTPFDESKKFNSRTSRART